jgi:hypothetical protein
MGTVCTVHSVIACREKRKKFKFEQIKTWKEFMKTKVIYEFGSLLILLI